MPAPSLYVVRHARVAMTENPKRLRSWLDVPLTPEGKKEAQQAADRLIAVGGIKAIYTSDLLRARQTTDEIIAHHPDSPAISTSELRPWHLGELQGKPVRDVGSALRVHAEQPDSLVAGGECMTSFLDRVLGFFTRLFRDDGTFIVVTHSRVIGALREWLAKGMRRDMMDLISLTHSPVVEKIPPGGIIRVKPILSWHGFEVL